MSTKEKVQQACSQLVGIVDKMERDNIVLPIGESWPEGLAEAVLEHYGKFAGRRLDDEGRDAIHVNAMSMKRSKAFDDMCRSLGHDPDKIPTITISPQS